MQNSLSARLFHLEFIYNLESHFITTDARFIIDKQCNHKTRLLFLEQNETFWSQIINRLYEEHCAVGNQNHNLLQMQQQHPRFYLRRIVHVAD